MNTTLSRAAAAEVAAGALIVPAFEGAAPQLGAACDAAIAQLYASGEFKGNALEVALLHAPAGLAAARLAVVGCGKQESLDTLLLRRAMGAAVRHLKTRGVKDCAVLLGPGLDSDANVAAAIEGAILGEWEPDRLKTDPEKPNRRLVNVTLVTSGAEDAFDRGVILGRAQNFTRDLVNEPSNLMTPLELASRARAMCAATGLECEVLDEDRMRQLGMGSLLAVAMGSLASPAFIIVRYRPAVPAASGVHLGLVGKGVTFDSGGISIKPADGMEKMKYDMAGGATMLGAMQAIAALKPAVPVTAFVPAVENMISGRAQRPGDIVTTLSGKTVEVLNTDAEGRLILNDALTYAQRQGCTHMVDAATLTGAIAVALGPTRAGAFTNNQPWIDQFLTAAAAQGERFWQMPLDDEYKEQLKSAFADLPNIGTRWGGAITAAYFLKEFADPTPWVHLDIAGTAWLDEAKPYMAKGPSGVAVRTLVELALGLA